MTRSRLRLTGAALATLTVAGCGGGGGARLLGDDPDFGDPPVAPLLGAPGVQLTDVALYQGVKRPLVQGGVQSSSNVAIIAGRDALVRVSVSNDGSFGRELTGRLHVGGGEPIEVTAQLSGASSEADLGSTLNFEVPGARLAADTTYRLELGQLGEVGAQGDPPVAFPAEAEAPIFVESVGSQLKIVIVPVRYNADGSGRLPDVSETQIALYRDMFGAMYPVPEVQISVREQPLDVSFGISAWGQNWDSLLQEVAELRQSDGAPADVYYYGAFSPEDSFNAYCQGGCVTGLAMAGGPSDTWARAAIGVGFTGPVTVETALHEVGHNHGRQHAPCQTQDADPQFPHPGGKLGVWGYDRHGHKMYPESTADIMGYCQPSWISDYNFLALKDRIAFVNQATSMKVFGDLEPRTYDRVKVGPDGQLTWLAPIDLRDPPEAEPTSIAIESADGDLELTGHFYPFDHLPGGLLFYERPEREYHAVTIRRAGAASRLVR